MFIFVGDSFTWGQGLYFEKWKKEGISVEKMNDFCKGLTSHEYFSLDLQEYRKEKRFPHIISKHFNKSYEVLNLMNGGSNWDIFIKINEFLTYANFIDLFVIQLTHINRMDNIENISNQVNYFKPLSNELLKNKKKFEKGSNEEKYQAYKFFEQTQFEYIKYLVKSCKSPIYCLSWLDEDGNNLKKIIPHNHIPIIHENETFDGFSKLIDMGFNLHNKIGCYDLHLDSEGHLIVANSIIKKIEENNLKKKIIK